MVQIETKRGSTIKKINCDFASETFGGTFNAKFVDARRLPKVARDFDNLESITLYDSLTVKVYTDYSKLVSISEENGAYMIRLAKDQSGKEVK